MGVNCYYDPDVSLAVLKVMKEAMEKEGIKKHLLIQPIGYKTPECYHSSYGMSGLQEFPFGKSEKYPLFDHDKLFWKQRWKIIT